MKTLCTLIAMVTCLSYGYSQDFMTEIDQRAEQIEVSSWSSDQDGADLLLEFYSAEIAKCDSDTLAKYPELVFRRAVAWSNTIELDDDAMADGLEQLSLVQQEYTFVLNNADKGSRLYDACAFQSSLVGQVVQANPSNVEGLISTVSQFLDNTLRQWAPDSMASGTELRQEVLANLNSNPDLMSSFCDFVLRSEDDPRISLGYIQPIQVVVTGLSDDAGPTTLDYEISYITDNGNGSVSIEGGL